MDDASNVKFFVEQIMPYYQDLYRFIYTIARDEAISADITQETMLKAWRHIARLREYENLKGGLMVMAKNNAFQFYRKQYRKREVSLTNMEEILLNLLHKDTPELMFIQQESNKKLIETVQELKNPYDQILILYYYYDIPFRDIAELMNVNYNTVLTWHRRALKAIKKKLAKEREKWEPEF